jgi:Sulfotransferase family
VCIDVSQGSKDAVLWRSRIRTSAAEVLSRAAQVAPRPNEALDGGYQRIYLYHVRKTAGTSISMAFFALSGRDPQKVERKLFLFSFVRSGGIRYVEHNAQLIRGGRYFFGVSHLPCYEARPPARGTFAFTVLRDPLSRVISLYKYLRTTDADKGMAFGAPEAERAWARGTFGEFLDRVPREDLLRQLFTFSSSGTAAEAVEEIGQLDLVMRTESLAGGIDALSAATGVHLDVGHVRASTSSGVDITESELDRARNLLIPEYDVLAQLDGNA